MPFRGVVLVMMVRSGIVALAIAVALGLAVAGHTAPAATHTKRAATHARQPPPTRILEALPMTCYGGQTCEVHPCVEFVVD
jgi:hypothetical protein